MVDAKEICCDAVGQVSLLRPSVQANSRVFSPVGCLRRDLVFLRQRQTDVTWPRQTTEQIPIIVGLKTSLPKLARHRTKRCGGRARAVLGFAPAQAPNPPAPG